MEGEKGFYKEFYKKREERRKEARENLPPGLQLQFPQERHEKERWSFEGNLLKLRHFQDPKDRLFIESLRLKVKERLNKEIKKEEWKMIGEPKETAKRI